MRNFCYAAILLGLFLIGCNISDLDFKNIKLERLSSDIAVPFGSATYTIRELLDDAANGDLGLEEDEETGELRLIYRDEASYTFSPDIFDVADFSNPSQINLPASATNPGPGNQNVNTTGSFFQVYESVDGEVIDSVFHAPGAALNVTLSSSNPALDVVYELTFQNTINIGTDQPVVISGDIGTSPVTNYDLENHKTLLTEVSGENRFNVSYDLDVTLEAGESISAGDQVTVNIEFANQNFIIVFGKLGQDLIEIANQSLNISFFDELELDGILFGGSELRFDFRSSFGIPIAMGLGGIYTEDSDGNQTFLSGGVVTNPPEIASSPTTHPVTGEVTQTQIAITTFNSNLEDLLSTSPTSITFDIEGRTNFYNPTALNFVTDTSTVRSFMELEMPMEVAMTNVEKVIDFDIGAGYNFSELDSMVLRLVTVSELPFAAKMNLLIMNDAQDTLFIALENEALDQPFLNIDRTVRESKTNIEDIPIGPAGIDALNNGTIIRLVIIMN
ncbi:MAG: hypothetical protein RIF46_11560, partial [Cyclobacteriaceae bacterium]